MDQYILFEQYVISSKSLSFLQGKWKLCQLRCAKCILLQMVLPTKQEQWKSSLSKSHPSYTLLHQNGSIDIRQHGSPMQGSVAELRQCWGPRYCTMFVKYILWGGKREAKGQRGLGSLSPWLLCPGAGTTTSEMSPNSSGWVGRNLELSPVSWSISETVPVKSVSSSKLFWQINIKNTVPHSLRGYREHKYSLFFQAPCPNFCRFFSCEF